MMESVSRTIDDMLDKGNVHHYWHAIDPASRQKPTTVPKVRPRRARRGPAKIDVSLADDAAVRTAEMTEEEKARYLDHQLAVARARLAAQQRAVIASQNDLLALERMMGKGPAAPAAASAAAAAAGAGAAAAAAPAEAAQPVPAAADELPVGDDCDDNLPSPRVSSSDSDQSESCFGGSDDTESTAAGRSSWASSSGDDTDDDDLASDDERVVAEEALGKRIMERKRLPWDT
jgi:hypothetical protein